MSQRAKSSVIAVTSLLVVLACYFSPYDQYTHWVQWCLWGFFCCLVLPLSIAIALGQPFSDLGLTIGDWRWGSIFVLVGLTIMAGFGFWAAKQPDFQAYYSALAVQHQKAPLPFWLALLAYMTGWEFLFRGFLLFGLAGMPKQPELIPRDLRTWGAIGFSTLLFGLSHWGKPMSEFFGSFIAGVALCLIAWRTCSCLAPILLHTLVFGLFMILIQYCSIPPFLVCS